MIGGFRGFILSTENYLNFQKRHFTISYFIATGISKIFPGQNTLLCISIIKTCTLDIE